MTVDKIMQRAKVRYLRLKIVNNFPTGYLSRGMLFSRGYWLFAVGGHCLRYPPAPPGRYFLGRKARVLATLPTNPARELLADDTFFYRKQIRRRGWRSTRSKERCVS